MPRRAHNDPPISIRVSLPQSQVEQLEAELRDPFTGKRRYGALSRLISRLLREWSEQQKEPQSHE